MITMIWHMIITISHMIIDPPVDPPYAFALLSFGDPLTMVCTLLISRSDFLAVAMKICQSERFG